MGGCHSSTANGAEKAKRSYSDLGFKKHYTHKYATPTPRYKGNGAIKAYPDQAHIADVIDCFVESTNLQPDKDQDPDPNISVEEAYNASQREDSSTSVQVCANLLPSDSGIESLSPETTPLFFEGGSSGRDMPETAVTESHTVPDSLCAPARQPLLSKSMSMENPSKVVQTYCTCGPRGAAAYSAKALSPCLTHPNAIKIRPPIPDKRLSLKRLRRRRSKDSTCKESRKSSKSSYSWNASQDSFELNHSLGNGISRSTSEDFVLDNDELKINAPIAKCDSLHLNSGTVDIALNRAMRSPQRRAGMKCQSAIITTKTASMPDVQNGEHMPCTRPHSFSMPFSNNQNLLGSGMRRRYDAERITPESLSSPLEAPEWLYEACSKENLSLPPFCDGDVTEMVIGGKKVVLMSMETYGQILDIMTQLRMQLNDLTMVIQNESTTEDESPALISDPDKDEDTLSMERTHNLLSATDIKPCTNNSTSPGTFSMDSKTTKWDQSSPGAFSIGCKTSIWEQSSPGICSIAGKTSIWDKSSPRTSGINYKMNIWDQSSPGTSGMAYKSSTWERSSSGTSAVCGSYKTSTWDKSSSGTSALGGTDDNCDSSSLGLAIKEGSSGILHPSSPGSTSATDYVRGQGDTSSTGDKSCITEASESQIQNYHESYGE